MVPGPLQSTSSSPEEDLILDLTELSITGVIPGSSVLGGAGAMRPVSGPTTQTSTVGEPVLPNTLESDIDGVVSEAIDEATVLLRELRQAEVKAAKLASSSASVAQLDEILVGFSAIGESIQIAQVLSVTVLSVDRF